MKTLVPVGDELKVVDLADPKPVYKIAKPKSVMVEVELPQVGTAGPARTAQLKRAFIKLYAQCGNIYRCAEAIGLERRRIYDWRDEDPVFLADMEEAKVASFEVLEGEAFRRAVEGVEEKRYDKDGNLVSETQRYSDNLLMFIMKAGQPAKYRDRYEVSGPNGGPIQMGLELLVTLNDRPAPEPNGHSNGHVVEGEVRELGGG